MASAATAVEPAPGAGGPRGGVAWRVASARGGPAVLLGARAGPVVRRFVRKQLAERGGGKGDEHDDFKHGDLLLLWRSQRTRNVYPEDGAAM